MTDIQEQETMWYPGIYGGRKGDYSRPASEFSQEDLIALVQQRAQEDGEWSIENGRVGDNEDVMRKMMEWVSRPENIIQCYRASGDPDVTVDWVCRDLANASKWVGGTRG
jgi:DNA-binding Lrp family transcriptional regulator